MPLFTQGTGKALGRLFISPDLKDKKIGRHPGDRSQPCIQSKEKCLQVKGESGRRCGKAITGHQIIVAATRADGSPNPTQIAGESDTGMIIESLQLTEIDGDMLFNPVGLKDIENLFKLSQGCAGTLVPRHLGGSGQHLTTAEETRERQDRLTQFRREFETSEKRLEPGRIFTGDSHFKLLRRRRFEREFIHDAAEKIDLSDINGKLFNAEGFKSADRHRNHFGISFDAIETNQFNPGLKNLAIFSCLFLGMAQNPATVTESQRQRQRLHPGRNDPGNLWCHVRRKSDQASPLTIIKTKNPFTQTITEATFEH